MEDFLHRVHTVRFHLYKILYGEKKIKEVDLEGGWQDLLVKVVRELSEITGI